MFHKILIPCYSLAGHHLEYLLNFYHYASTDFSKEHKYVFTLVDDFKETFDRFPSQPNIEFDYIPTQDLKKLNIGNMYVVQYKHNIVTRRYIKKHRPTNVLYLAFNYNFLLQSLMTIKGVKYSGILFRVYPYDFSSMSIRYKLHTILSHWGAVHNKWITNIFISNDTTGVAYLNKLYKTDKFKYVPDPYVPISAMSNTYINSNEVLLMKAKRVLFHFGSFRRGKGTVELLKAILLTPKDVAQQLCFILAGKVPDDLHDEIYSLVGQCSIHTTLIFHDEFCSFEYISEICRRSDFILMPYSQSSSSSGMYGYAAQFGVPIVAPNKNMTRKIVRRNQLGILLDDISPKGLSEFYCTIPSREKYRVGTRYLETNTVAAFTDAIFSKIFVE